MKENILDRFVEMGMEAYENDDSFYNDLLGVDKEKYLEERLQQIRNLNKKIMENKKLGQESAFPLCVENENGPIHYAEGLNKRFYAACAAMNGIISKENKSGMTIKDVVSLSYRFADELLKQEEEL